MPRAVLVSDAKLSGPGITWFLQQFGEQLSEPPGVLGMDQFKRVASGKFAVGVAQIPERGGLRVLRVSNLGKAQSGQLSFGVAEHLAEGAIRFQDSEIRAAQHDADGPFLKDFPESFLALAQRFFGTREVIRQQSQFTRALLNAAS